MIKIKPFTVGYQPEALVDDRPKNYVLTQPYGGTSAVKLQQTESVCSKCTKANPGTPFTKVCPSNKLGVFE